MTFRKRLKQWCAIGEDWLETPIQFDKGWGLAIVIVLIVQAITL